MPSFQQRPVTIGEVLSSQRQRRFVGRRAELELFRSALAAAAPDVAVMHLHGPGGIGKTCLLDRFAGVAAAEGATVVRLDARELAASPCAVLDTMRPMVEVPNEGPIEVAHAPLVLSIDSYERFAPIDDWVRKRLVPRLPVDSLTVLAGRTPPGPGWRSDPAWHDLLRVVSLRNLDPEDSRDYLTACGVDPALHDELIRLTHGHPLGLSLCTDVVVRGGDVGTEGLHPDLVGDLVRGFVEVVPEDPQRTVLASCAQARVTTAELLREVLGPDTSGEEAYERFAWLQDLSFIEVSPDGVFPHELARDVLDADLRWRDALEYNRIFRRVAGSIRGRVLSLQGREQQRAISDLKFLFRHIPGVLSPIDWDAWGQHHPEPGRSGDRDAVLEAYQEPSPTLNAVPIVTLQRQLATRNLAWDYLTMHEPEAWDDFFALADLHRAPEADFEVAGRRYGVFAHDFRERTVDDLIDLWIERSLAQDPKLEPDPGAGSQVLSQVEFTAAVRQALRDLRRPDLLNRNPLMDTRLLREQAAGEVPDASTLQALMREAIDTLRQHPRDDKLLRAVERTYVDPAPTQEAAAARLGLPFSTYRRHLTQGAQRVVAWLWDQEVYGPRGSG